MVIRLIVIGILGIISLIPGQQSIVNFYATSIISPPATDRVHLNNPIPHTWIAYPTKITDLPLNLSASSVYAVDLDSAKVLYEQAANTTRPIASLTKLVTAMVILHTHDLDEIVTIPPLPTYQPDDAKLGITAGQQFKLVDLLSATLIPSANDAADALAIYDSGSLALFTAKMNNLAKQWGIVDAHFTSANGLHEQDNYASASALAKFAKIALHNPYFAKTVSSSSSTISDQAGNTYALITTNRLLANNRFTGLKTGFTAAAGQSLIALTTSNGHQIITVVLNSPDRFAETTALANWIDQSYRWD